jgi:stalled ribosome rescue protein Dom34
MSITEILQESDKLTYQDYFEKLRKNQKAKVVSMLSELLERARSFNFDDFSNRVAIDGQITESEKKHIDIMKSLFENRIRRLSTSVSLLKKYVGQSNE